MRTTITLDDGLASDLKRHAAQAGLSVSALIERLLRAALTKPARASAPPRFRLVTVKGGGLRGGVDLDRMAKLTEEADAEALVRSGH
jgi:hypothetical protein